MDIYTTPTPETTRTFTCTVQSRVTYKALMEPEQRVYTITSEQGNHFLSNPRYLIMRAEAMYRNEVQNRMEDDHNLYKLLSPHDWVVSVSLLNNGDEK